MTCSYSLTPFRVLVAHNSIVQRPSVVVETLSILTSLCRVWEYQFLDKWYITEIQISDVAACLVRGSHVTTGTWTTVSSVVFRDDAAGACCCWDFAPAGGSCLLTPFENRNKNNSTITRMPAPPRLTMVESCWRGDEGHCALGRIRLTGEAANARIAVYSTTTTGSVLQGLE